MHDASSGISIVDSDPLPYLLSLPGSSATARAPDPAPVLCFLHGYDEAAPVEIRRALTRHGPLRTGSWPGVLDGWVVVAPQLPQGGDIWHRYADAVLRIVKEVQRTHGADVRRTYLTGFSFGANGVFDLAHLQPDVWAALWGVDPTRVPRHRPEAPTWLSFGEASRSRKAVFIRALRLESAERCLDGDRLYLDEGEDHVGSARLAYSDARIYGWLLGRATSPQP